MKQEKRPTIIPEDLTRSETDLIDKLTIATALVLFASFFLIGCGTASDETESPEVPSIVDGEAPDFSRWSAMPTAEDTCTQVGIEAPMQCRTGFMAGDKNCGNATFKFVAIVDGYMYVQTMNEVVIRQGEYHILNFDQTPEVYRVEDETTDWYQSYYKCLGQEGKL